MAFLAPILNQAQVSAPQQQTLASIQHYKNQHLHTIKGGRKLHNKNLQNNQKPENNRINSHQSPNNFHNRITTNTNPVKSLTYQNRNSPNHNTNDSRPQLDESKPLRQHPNVFISKPQPRSNRHKPSLAQSKKKGSSTYTRGRFQTTTPTQSQQQVILLFTLQVHVCVRVCMPLLSLQFRLTVFVVIQRHRKIPTLFTFLLRQFKNLV